ncbi:hypothetical protein PR202_gb28023 [Eleusine coracana subsp. coracana]|uniref:Uncharacterized protein n=1 Tax=Eleusine coracana subsp. coracana TaxID=191504 RepID=A0AAV5FXR0_ELECO|nr:hypothetical protein PR202_gb28023 [Eleusine coracana subsp. coracana]
MYENGLLFGRNEVEPGDTAHLDHDLLKHCLEILKLAEKQQAGTGRRRMTTMHQRSRRAKRCLERCVRRLASDSGGETRPGASSVTIVPRICSGDDAVHVGAVQKRTAAKKINGAHDH